MAAPTRRLAQVLLAATLGATLSACGADTSSAAGGPADPDDADRVVQVSMFDDLSYDPEQITVSVGEVITIEATNAGETRHELVLGDADDQADHMEGMEEMDHGDGMEGMEGMDHGDGMEGMGGSEVGVLSLAPGASGSLTWTFSQPGTYQYACHEPGHYEGGMVGTIVVEG